jgi:hypothetical protein
MRLLVVTAALTVGFLPAPADPQGQTHLTGMYFVHGSCGRLTTPDGDHTAECNKALGLVTYANGRRSFWFSIPHKSLVAFSGFATENEQGTMQLDMVTIASSPNPQPASAKGSCTFDDAWKGLAHVRCQATSDAGNFSAEFTTDGKAPEGQSTE